MPSPKHLLFSHLTAAGISIGAAFSPQIGAAQNVVSSEVASLMYCHQNIDIASISERYTIQAGDTFSKIASQRGISYGDFVLVWNYMNPGKNIDDTIRVGDQFFVMKAGAIYKEKLDTLKAQLTAKNNFDEANALFQNGKIDELEKKYGFEIIPKLPIGIGIESKMRNYLHEFENNPIAYGARTVFAEYQTQTICANLSRSTTRDAINLNDPLLPPEIKALLSKLNIDAWHFHDAFLEAGYTQKFNLREYFGRLQSGTSPIRADMKDAYQNQLILMMRYLKTDGKADTKIPVFFLHTGAVSSIMSYKGGNNPSSHVFAYVGEGIQKPFRADFFSDYQNILPQYKREFKEGMNIEEYIIDLVQMRSGWGFSNQDSYRSIIRENLLKYGEFVGLYVNGKKIDIVSEFEKPTIFLSASDQIQLGGSVVYDGVHIKTAVDPDLQDNMNTRLMLLWEIFAVDGYFPAEILEPPQVFLDYGKKGKYAEILKAIPVQDVSYLKEGEDVELHILNLIAYNLFGISSYEELSTLQKIEAGDELEEQKLAHMLYGNLTLDGSSWTEGATRVNRAFYYYDTTHIKETFHSYIEERKKDFYENISVTCSIGDTLAPEFMQIVFFPNMNKSGIFTQMEKYLIARKSLYLETLHSMDVFQKDLLLNRLLGPDIVGGKFQAGKNIFVSYNILEQELQYLKNMNYLPEIDQLSDNDRTLFELLSGTQGLEELLAFLIVNESYINAPGFKDDGVEGILGLNELWGRIGRKGQKELYRFLHEHNLLPLLKDVGEGYKKIPTQGPRSFGDFQIRFENLYNPETAFKQWPQKSDILEAVHLVLTPPKGLKDMIMEVENDFPQRIAQDIHIAKDIKQELEKDTPNPLRIAELLKELFQMNDATNKYIIGKIIAAKLLEIKLKGHSENIAEQFRSSNIEFDISSPEMRIRFAKYMLLINNMGESRALAAVFENYLRRAFLFYQEKYPERGIILPLETRKSEGIGGEKAIYTMEFLKSDILLYLSQIDKIPELEFLRDDMKRLLSDGLNSGNIYTFLKDSEITQVYKTLGIEANILPTQKEIFSRAIFGYANEILLEKRIPEPERMLSDFRGVGIIGFLGLYTVFNSLAGLGNIAFKTIIIPSGIIGRGITRTAGRGISKVVGGVKGYIQKKIALRKEEKKLIFTNDTRFKKKAAEYQDGRYKISGEIIEKLETIPDSNIVAFIPPPNQKRFPIAAAE